MTPLKIAETYIGLTEVPGAVSDPTVLSMLRRVQTWPKGDEVPWCSAFIHACTRPLGLPATNSLLARSWLNVGDPIDIEDAEPGFDLVVFTRADATSDPSDLEAPGHVAWFLGLSASEVTVLGGNQGDRVSRANYPRANVLGVRRL